MKDSKIGIIIIGIIIALGVILISVNINNKKIECDTPTTKKGTIVYDGFDQKVLADNKNKLAVENLNGDSLKSLFLDGLFRGGLLEAQKVEDYKVNILQDDDSRDRFKYKATGEFKCNTKTTCSVNVNGEYVCDDICINVPIDEFMEKTGYYRFIVKFNIKLNDGKYTFDGFEVEKHTDNPNVIKSNGEEEE